MSYFHRINNTYSMPSRYKQLEELVRINKPGVILEVGTCAGDRAIAMLQHSPRSHYIGFDLFEEATQETDKREFNVKRHHSMNAVAMRLKDYDVELIKGDTRKTLPEFVANGPARVGLAFIDGGHSIETIHSDWKNVKKIMLSGGLVVFDDFYSNFPVERINVVGCNRVLETLGRPYRLLPIQDWVIGGGLVQIAVVEI